MSSLVRHFALAAVGRNCPLGKRRRAIARRGPAPARRLARPVGGLPTNNLPVAGPLLQNILAQPSAQQAISPTLDSVSGLSGIVADAGAPTLLELRRLRLQELIRDNRATVESDGNGLPVRRGIVAVIDPDPVGLQRALGAGFRVAGDDRDPALGMRVVSLAVPNGMSAKDGLKRLHKVAPELQADFDHLFEPAGGGLAADRGGARRGTGRRRRSEPSA